MELEAMLPGDFERAVGKQNLIQRSLFIPLDKYNQLASGNKTIFDAVCQQLDITKETVMTLEGEQVLKLSAPSVS